jgi:cholesterol oxidase
MVGCRHNAKNTLVKNYLYFAERAGVQILPERTVAEVRPLGADDGSQGYTVTSERSGAWFKKDRQTLTARGVVVAAGALGTNQLLQRCRIGGALPRLSQRVGHLVRTNSEAISAVTTKDDRHDFTKSIAITSSFYPDADTHIENVTYGPGADSISFLFTVLGKARSKLTRPLWPLKWSRRTVILLTMQTLDNSMRLIPKRNLFGPGPRLQTQEDPDKPNPRFIEASDKATRRAAEKLDATPQAGLTEQLFNIPTTAHIMGGAVIGEGPGTGVVDRHNRVFGYENLLVCDGAAIPANVGVNPSLTITALSEHAMSHVAAREQRESVAAT